MREFKGIVRGVLIGILCWGIIIWVFSCGSGGEDGSVNTVFTEMERRDMTAEELDWWVQVANCLVNKELTTHDMISGVQEPFVVVAEGPFMCEGYENARGCGLLDMIILSQDVVGYEAWFKHEACHIYDKWVRGRTDHNGVFWYPEGHQSYGACICQ